ncbi:MAG: histidine kinase [Alphaproteobacteria bacterium]|nr:MAG: histidine kinase [Alphaproteobacteria bacterium]
MTNSIKSKRYTASDIATRKSSRWFRIGSHRGDIEQLFDLYWGGKERRITGLTLRIIGVNVIALVSLIFGVIYLGQYHSTLIESKLKRFETEVILVTAAISEGAVSSVVGGGEAMVFLSSPKVQNLSARLGATLGKRILVFDTENAMVADSKIIIESHSIKPIFTVVEEEKLQLDSVELLKDMASWIVSLFPQYKQLPLFPGVLSQDANHYADVIKAKGRTLSISAWRDARGEVVLTAALPIVNQSEIVGIVMLIGDDEAINSAMGDAWFNILKIFLVTLLITILLSIYLSGVIARPLRKLANAAENVRRGKLKHTEIPDMSERNDEIGELSIVLRDMTAALWERMDTIEAFAADVSHEIKNPLTSLKSAVETTKIVKNKNDMDKLLTVIAHDVDRLDRLITDISNASRLDAELSREAFDMVDLKKMLRDLLNVYKSPLERECASEENNDRALKDGVMIMLDFNDVPDIYVSGSEGRLTQVFQNIIANALSFASVKTKIKILVKMKANRVTISIEDEGPGIPESQLEKIFERFYSERPKHEEFGRHSGLGLSICRQIVTAHNGIIYAENKLDRSGAVTGARFVIILSIDQ